MTTVDMPFHPQMADAVLEGRKCCTTRSTKKGSIGDLFMVREYLYRIVEIRLHPLDFIARNYYSMEGCDGPQEFRDLWMDLHKGAYDPKDLKYVHFFAAVRLHDARSCACITCTCDIGVKA